MKRLFLLLLPVLIFVFTALAGLTYLQDRLERARLLDELHRKAKAIAESSEDMIAVAVISGNTRPIRRFAESFEKRERPQGAYISISGTGKSVSNKKAQKWEKLLADRSKSAFGLGKAVSSTDYFENTHIYSYTIPLKTDDKGIIGTLTIAYDTGYIDAISEKMWKDMSLYTSVLSLFLAILLFLLHRQIFILPLIKLTEWFKKYQSGEADADHKMNDKDEIGRLISEVEQVALSLRIAKKAAAEEASKRIKKQEAWTDLRLRDLVKAKIGENAFFVVSNREPYMHVKDKNSSLVKCITPAGGVVTALDPVLRASGGTWVAHGAGDMDRKYVNSRDKLGVPPENDRYILKRVWLTKEEEEGYYYGFSNEGLWPLCHVTHTRPEFRQSDWEMYVKANEKFARAVIEELPKGSPLVFIQDYHFTLLAGMIKKERPDAIIAMFWHIPWPNPEIFAICPYYKEILSGMLACDIIGFHTQFHCNNFMDTANRFLENRLDMERFSVNMNGHETLIRAFPISIEGFGSSEIDRASAEGRTSILPELNLQDIKIGIGVDRIDYTKGIIERINALSRFFEKYPEHIKKFTFIQVGAPSRTHIKKYHDLMAEIDAAAEAINWKFGDADWKPLIYIKRHLSYSEILPFYALSELCVVSSLHDGMNLVAKEYVSAKKDLNGALVLSGFTGASRELTDAIIINPYSTEEFADAINRALVMPPEEKRRRMQSMRESVSSDNVFKWAGSIINELAQLAGRQQ